MRKIVILLFAGLSACTWSGPKKIENAKDFTIPETTINQLIDSFNIQKEISDLGRLEKGIRHIASLWREEDGTADDFVIFCKKNVIKGETNRELFFEKVSKYLESVYGHFNKITLNLKENVDLDYGLVMDIDEDFSSYAVGSHLLSDMYANKIAFKIALNFPYYSLTEKENFSHSISRKEWAMVRLGDIFVSRVPAELEQAVVKSVNEADMYISSYNIMMGKILNEKGEALFPEAMVLLSHWNLRDEIKANYGNNSLGKEKQELLYTIMERIVSQQIPENVINNPKYQWAPISNKVFENGKEIPSKSEPNNRYQQIINNFKAEKAIDNFSPELNTFISRKFSAEMEISLLEVETLFDQYLRSPQLAKVGMIIKQRLGRDLRPYDIWYDGFKTRSSISQDVLNRQTVSRYPNSDAFKSDMPRILMKLGWSKDRATFLSDKIVVDAARGSGHAWGAGMRGEKSHLRTRIQPKGMDYKGYNIAVHEFGHNIEQTNSLYNIDYFLLNGVPNTAFTEALAFIFQSRDLSLLGIEQKLKNQEQLRTLDTGWSLMEIMGVGLVDIRIWKWLYAHPESSAADLNTAVQNITKEVWNTYFSEIFGVKDQVILGIYSHMISNPLYLAAYSYGQIIEFQIEEHLKDKDFANEIDRIYQQGKLIPQRWMEGAVGSRISIKPILNKLDKAIN